MAAPQYVVVELRVDASNADQGAAQYSSALGKAQQAADALTNSAGKAQAAITSQGNAMVQAKAANDNLASGYKAANDNFNAFGSSLAQHAIDFLNNVNHLKLMALGAYAISPAFRSFTNTEIAAAVKLLGVNITLVESAIAGVVRFAAPMLSFFASIAVPIGIALLAWQGLNYVISTGASLLDKYGNSERSFFGSDVQENLDKLTKYQNDSISQQQVQYATDLGARLNEAKATISQFFSVQLDVTNQALALQDVWVTIVETIAKAVTGIDNLTNHMSNGQLTSILAAIPIIGVPMAALNLGSQLAPQPSQGDALALAKNKLAAAMGGGFAGRFTGDISSLSKPPTTDTSTNAYDRSLQSIKDQIDLLSLEADGAGKTSQAYEELKTAHTLNIAAMKAGIPVTDDMRATWKSLGDQIAAYTIQVNQAKVLQQEMFQNATMFMSPSELAAASAAKQIDPTNWQAHLTDAGPMLAAFNSELSQTRDLSAGFANDFGQAMLQGKTATEALQSALTNLESQLINMASKQLVNAAFGGLTGSDGFNLLSLLGIGTGGVLPGGSPLGAGGIGHARDGGIVGQTAFPKKYIHPAYFENAPHFDNGGMITDGGVPIVAHPGERILNAAETKAYNGAGKPLNQTVTINNYGADVQTSSDDQGNLQVNVRAMQAVARDTYAGSSTNAIAKQKYGQSPLLRQRR